MEIYLCFLQHVLYSIKDGGKGAIVVPTGFLTAQSGIAQKIKQYLVDNRFLKGVISMPSNIFANTGTNVSVVFIDKTALTDNAVLIDASKLGETIKDGKNQKTVLIQMISIRLLKLLQKTKLLMILVLTLNTMK